MKLIVDDNFEISGANLGSLEGCDYFAKLVGESIDIQTFDLRDPRYEAQVGVGRGQYDAARILDCFEEYQFPSSDRMMILTSLDITAYANRQWLNFVFGMSTRSTACIISTFRFQGLPSNLALDANRLIAIHELGHIWGLVPENTARSDSRSGLYTGHCTARCAMRQVMSVDEAVRLSTELGSDSFCVECHNHLTG
jgi:predicted Zn-dependent protease